MAPNENNLNKIFPIFGSAIFDTRSQLLQSVGTFIFNKKIIGNRNSQQILILLFLYFPK